MAGREDRPGEPCARTPSGGLSPEALMRDAIRLAEDAAQEGDVTSAAMESRRSIMVLLIWTSSLLSESILVEKPLALRARGYDGQL